MQYVHGLYSILYNYIYIVGNILEVLPEKYKLGKVHLPTGIYSKNKLAGKYNIEI